MIATLSDDTPEQQQQQVHNTIRSASAPDVEAEAPKEPDSEWVVLNEEASAHCLDISGCHSHSFPQLSLRDGERSEEIIHSQVTELMSEKIGEFHLTNASIYYITKEEEEESKQFEIPLWMIHKISLTTDTLDENAPVLELHCKNLRLIRFKFNSIGDGVEILAERLHALCFAATFLGCFAMQNKSNPYFLDDKNHAVNGWSMFSWDEEYQRMGVSEQWRICEANVNYEICKSYPPRFIVPSAITDEQVKEISQFRSSGRVTALSYYHHANGATITRCSQPLVGLLWARSDADEEMLRAVRLANPNNTTLKIVDCRTRMAALANKAKRGGTECLQYYENCDLEFSGIENIHVMRDALHDLELTIRGQENNADTAWRQHISILLRSAKRVAELIRKGHSVLIHCSDGWDRTAQMSALAQVLLDPFYRTIRGFEILVEKEWLQFGHKFGDRVSHGKGSFWSTHECSPIFLQFIDAVFQMVNQSPEAFEFNKRFLSTLMDQTYNCFFGTFLANNCREREELKLAQRTPSVWNYMNDKERLKTFKPNWKTKKNTVRVKDQPMDIMIWDYYRGEGLIAGEEEDSDSDPEPGLLSVSSSGSKYRTKHVEGTTQIDAVFIDDYCPNKSSQSDDDDDDSDTVWMELNGGDSFDVDDSGGYLRQVNQYLLDPICRLMSSVLNTEYS